MKKNLVKGIILIVLGVLLLILNIPNVINNKEEKEIEILGNSYIENITIYGRFFNIEGYLETTENLEELNLVLENGSNLTKYKLIYEQEANKISFKTNEVINKGILLDDILVGDYKCYLEAIIDEEIKYYSFINNTEYKDDMTYYTLSKDNKNNKVIISIKDNLTINVTEAELPENVYDIVIDPGHGGKDAGAVSGSEYEKDYNLSLSVDLKQAFEELGYKVKLTRTGDYSLDEYNENGRVTICHKASPKLAFSVHLNADHNFTEGNGGVEVYAPYNADLAFTKSLADNLVNMTGSQYSKNEKYKIDNGVYVRTFLPSEIEKYKNEMDNPYPYKEDLTYYYMLRETGGIITGAYVDGRSEKHGLNPYYNSNIGIESYILELGYLISDIDLNNIKENSDKYIEAIKVSVKDYLQ